MLSKNVPTGQLLCAIRNQWIAATPEELVRQKLIFQLTQELGYPRSGLAIETGLNQIPHLKYSALKVPKRRTDLIFFAKGIHPQYDLYPLLLIECKAVKLTEKAIRQTAGYNFHLKATFFALINQNERKLGWFDPKVHDFSFISEIPSFSHLIKKYSDLTQIV